MATLDFDMMLDMRGISPRIARLQRAAARAAAFNQEDADLAANVTLTMEGTADAALPRIFIAVEGAAPLLNRTVFDVCRFSGGRPTFTEDGQNRLVFPVASIAPSTSGSNLSSPLPSTPSYNAWGWEAAIVTEAPKVQLRTAGNPVSGTRVTINGKYVSKSALNFVNTNSQNYTTLVFPDRVPRLIGFELAGGSTQLQSIAVAPNASISMPGVSDKIIAFVTGDSYSEGTGASIPGLFGFPKIMGRMLGWSDVRQVAVGQTGYLSNSSGNRKTIRQQIADWFVVNSDVNPRDVDVVCLAGGFNDYAQANVLTLLQAEVAATIAAVRAACPNALIIVFGSHAGARGPDTQTLAVDALIQAGFAQAADRRSVFVPIASDPSPWTFGTGKVGATVGDGNADFFISADGIHPSDAGHLAYARRATNAVRTALANIR